MKISFLSCYRRPINEITALLALHLKKGIIIHYLHQAGANLRTPQGLLLIQRALLQPFPYPTSQLDVQSRMIGLDEAANWIQNECSAPSFEGEQERAGRQCLSCGCLVFLSQRKISPQENSEYRFVIPGRTSLKMIYLLLELCAKILKWFTNHATDFLFLAFRFPTYLNAA